MPACYPPTLVMATGILAIATWLLGVPPLGWFFLGVGGAAYLILWGLTLIRVIYYFPHVLADINTMPAGWASLPWWRRHVSWAALSW